MVISVWLFHNTESPLTKPEPLTVRLKPELPGVTLAGLSEVMTGPLLEPTVKLKGDVETPAVVTVTFTEPALAIRLAGTVAVSCVELLKPVDSGVPLKDTPEPNWKPVPFTVSWKLGPPGRTKVGLRLEMLELEDPPPVPETTK